jgi:hypothetical protein
MTELPGSLNRVRFSRISRSSRQFPAFVPAISAGNLRTRPESARHRSIAAPRRALRRRTAAQVRHAAQNKAVDDFPQPMATGREKFLLLEQQYGLSRARVVHSLLGRAANS